MNTITGLWSGRAGLETIYFFAALLSCAPAWAANYAACVLKKLPGLASETAAQAAYQMCLLEHPGGFQVVPQGSGRSMQDYKSGAECTVAKSKDTRSERAKEVIGMACRQLYDESEIDRFRR